MEVEYSRRNEGKRIEERTNEGGRKRRKTVARGRRKFSSPFFLRERGREGADWRVLPGSEVIERR